MSTFDRSRLSRRLSSEALKTMSGLPRTSGRNPRKENERYGEAEPSPHIMRQGRNARILFPTDRFAGSQELALKSSSLRMRVWSVRFELYCAKALEEDKRMFVGAS